MVVLHEKKTQIPLKTYGAVELNTFGEFFNDPLVTGHQWVYILGVCIELGITDTDK